MFIFFRRKQKKQPYASQRKAQRIKIKKNDKPY